MKLNRIMLEVMGWSFVKCPTTGKILEVLKGDDKVICQCGKSGSKEPKGYTERSSTHFVCFCESATIEEYMSQEEEKEEKMNKEEEWQAFKEKWIQEFPDEKQLRKDFEFHWKRIGGN